MKNNMIFYEVHPKYFKDFTGTGTGDLKGLADKMSYFNFIGIDALIFPDLLATQSIDINHNFMDISKDLGTMTDLKKIIAIAKLNNIKIIMDLNIGSISSSHKWFKSAINKEETFENIVEFRKHKWENLTEADYKYEKTRKSYYIVDSITKEISLNWGSEETLMQFVEVVKFWESIGIDGFTFINFESINNYTQNLMTDETLIELRKLYVAIKRINDDILIIGKSDKLIPEAGLQFTEGPTKVFDYTQLNTMPFIGSSEKYGADLTAKFSQSRLVNKLREHVKSKNDIITFGSIKIGRITSRWGDEGQYAYESAKTLGLLLLTTSSPACIYFGDELGTKNLELTNLDDFQDETINERKRHLADLGISEKKFMQSQITQNPIHAKIVMPWNASKNGGFSIADKIITAVSESYRVVNVESQFRDEHSPLNFYKSIIKMFREDKIKKIMQKGTYEIKIQKFGLGVIEVIRAHETNEVRFLINLSKKEKQITLPRNGGKVTYSSYGYKKYKELPRTLQPFESIVITKETDEVIDAARNAQLEKERLELKAKKEKEQAELKAKKEKEQAELKAKKEKEQAELKAEKEQAELKVKKEPTGQKPK